MTPRRGRFRLMAGAVALLVTPLLASPAGFPDPLVDVRVAPNTREQTAVFAGGCFWGVEAVFEELSGVKEAVSGYSGGSRTTAHYEVVGTGRTGHAESVRITYDPARISYGQLLKIFFAVAHDPTELNRQGPDIGTQYRSSIFGVTADQRAVAEAYIRQLNDAKIFARPIATTVVPLEGFYPAEPYHQNFIARNPTDSYVVVNDLPKLRQLRHEYPALLKAR